MKNAFIFHGTGGYPEENWFPWLKTKLDEQGILTTVPQFPTPEGQSLESWLAVMQPHESEIDQETVLIGHSLGGLFLLRYLEQLGHSVGASVFVAASAGVKPIKLYEADSEFSGGFDFNWGAIRRNAGTTAVFHSDNDPYVSLGNGEKIAAKLGVTLHRITHADHFNTTAGYTTFPLLQKEIEHMKGEVRQP